MRFFRSYDMALDSLFSRLHLIDLLHNFSHIVHYNEVQRVGMAKKILVAEDDEDNRDLVVFMLQRSGLELELLQAENGQEAVDLAIQHVPDLILMDMQMPVMDGFAAVKLIKANPAIHHIPIIAFTAQARAEDKTLTKAIGCVEHYTKPMDPVELTNLIRKYANI